jgi:hypothetical protein
LGLYDEKNDSLVYFQAVLVRNYLKSFSMNKIYFFFKISVFLWFVFIYGLRLVLWFGGFGIAISEDIQKFCKEKNIPCSLHSKNKSKTLR